MGDWVGKSCPVCGWSDASTMERHLIQHSKLDLVHHILGPGPNNSNKSNNPSTSSASLQIPQDEDSCISNSFSSRPLTNLQPVEMLVTTEPNNNNNNGDHQYHHQRNDQDFVPVTALSTPHKEKETSGSSHKNNRKVVAAEDEIIVPNYLENSTLSTPGPSDDSRSKPAVEEESDNATSQTSIIKYIIDQNNGKASTGSERRGEERWILSDGREIPVYSSYGLAKASSSHAGIMIGEDIGPPASLNLMTDEEIPPRGEISEYEESNTSSLISEDSNIKPRITIDIKNVPLLPNSMQNPKKRKGKQAKSGDGSGPGHQFLCYECPAVQKFKSLFELIGHKVKFHPSVTQEFAEGDNASSSVPMIFHSTNKQQMKEPREMKLKVTKEFFCIYCNLTVGSKVELGRHMENDHSDKPLQPAVFECTTCGKTFQARTNLRKHLVIHRERKHACSTCSKRFTSNFKLMEHERVHTKIYPHKCKICDKDYRTPSLLNHHIKTTHVPESEKPVKPKVELYCGICKKILRSKRSYICHAKTHTETPKKCPYCCETFSRQSVLVRHIRVSHDSQYESSESKNCPVCHKKMHPNAIKKHLLIHEGSKPFTCQVCSRQFRTYANLSSHSWSHTNGDRPFKCKICPKSYLFKRTLEHHVIIHKRRTLHFVCNECGVRFTNKVNMKRHSDEHYSEKKFKCKTCGKAFKRNYYLLEHERTHSNLKPYVCNFPGCNKASTTRSNHRAHIKIHDARETGSQEG